jgi:hypothetical protein
MFSRNADNILDRIKNKRAMKRKIQFAFNNACKAAVRLIFVEMYQKQRIVMATFNNNFRDLIILVSFFLISMSDVWGI